MEGGRVAESGRAVGWEFDFPRGARCAATAREGFSAEDEVTGSFSSSDSSDWGGLTLSLILVGGAERGTFSD